MRVALGGRSFSGAVLAGAAVVLAVLIITQVAPHEAPMGTVLYGVVYGSLNGLLAVGLVLLFRVTRAINFAYGAMGGVPAGIGASIYLSHHWPWFLVIALSVVFGGLVGLAVGALFEWRFSRAPRLVITVATVGLSQLLGGISLYVPRWFHGPALIASFSTGLSKAHTEINPVVFDGNDLLVVIVVPMVVLAVSWFLLRTSAGRAVRAIADNPDRARLIGIPARRLVLGVWAISGAVAAMSVVLASPSQGIPISAAAGPAILLAPLAAAVVARMQSLTVAFTAAVGLGVLEELVRLNISKQSIETPVFLAVIIVALLLQRRPEGRAEAAEETSWSASGDIKPLPAIVRSLPEIKAAFIVASLAIAGVALWLPTYLGPGRLDEVSVGIVFGLGALSLVVLTGWAGTVSLGQMALVGLGSITAGDLMMHLNLDLFQSLVAAGAVGAAAAVVLGLPALRVKGLYLAVTTLAFAVAADNFFFNPTDFAQELPSSVLRPVVWKRFNLHSEIDLYYVCLATLVFAVALILGIRRARPGRAILGTRDNPRAAEAASVSSTRTRLMAFAISGVIAGVAGGLYVVILGGIAYGTFQPTDSITVFSEVVIGGLSSVAGSLGGVALIQWLGIEFPNLQIILTGVGLLVVLMVFPAGLAGLYERARDSAARRLARRHGLSTSVWADSEPEKAESEEPAVTRELEVLPADLEPVSEGAILSCSQVDAAYGQMQVLFGVDLEVRDGEILALLGTNGAGKSSLLRSITGLLPPSRGKIQFLGANISSSVTEKIASRGLTMMPGGRGIFPTLTVQENLRVACWPLRSEPDGGRAAMAAVMEMFPILSERSGQPAANLSGGEQQMLSLAMAFLPKPKLLCIDELSLGLAPAIVGTLIDAVREIHRQGTTVVIVEQSVNVALLLAERAVFLEKGQVRFSGPAKGLLERPDLLRAVFIGGSDSKPKKAAVRSRTKVSAAVGTNGTVSANGKLDHPVGGTNSTPVLECVDLVKRFGGITAVDSVNLVVRPGEVVGVIGHNGAGKTTLFDVISGFLKPQSGKVVLGGDDVTDFAPFHRAIGGLGRSFQEARLFPSLTVRETVSVAMERHLASREPFAAAFRMPASTDSEAQVGAVVDVIIRQLGLTAYRNRPTGDLSTGTRRIVELACVMAQRPAVLLLDEPSGGIAQAETEALGPLLRKVATDTGCAMVVIEHDMNLLAGLSDRLVALELGRVIASGSPTEVLAHPQVIASYLGTDPDTIDRSGTKPARRRTKPPSTRAVSTN